MSQVLQRVEVQSLSCIPLERIREIRICSHTWDENDEQQSTARHLVAGVDDAAIRSVLFAYGRAMMRWNCESQHHSLAERWTGLVYLCVWVKP